MDINTFDVTVGAAVLPPLIALLNQHPWNSQLKALVALLICFAYAGVVEVIRGPLDLHAWRQTALTVTASALGAHKLFWKPSGIGDSIEQATTIDPLPAALAAPATDPPPVSLPLLPDPAPAVTAVPVPDPATAAVPDPAPVAVPDPAAGAADPAPAVAPAAVATDPTQALLADWAERNGYVKT